MSRDPLGIWGDAEAFGNPYVYAMNNPWTYVDPFGLDVESSDGWTWLDYLQASLDAGGFVPGIGAIPDLANAGISTLRGNYWEALFSAGAAVPIIGDLAGAGKFAAKYGDEAAGILGKAARHGDDLPSPRQLEFDFSGSPKTSSRIPNSELQAPPRTRGNAPIGKDGHPVELHHRGQKPDSPLDEMTRTDHRGKGNFKKNHENTGKAPSEIDRSSWRQQQRQHWRDEFDAGRFDDIQLGE